MQSQAIDTDYPLVVDLDGTLINTDLLYEGFILLKKEFALYFSLFHLAIQRTGLFENKNT